MSLLDWLVIGGLVALPIGALWLYVEIDSWRREQRAARRRRRRRGYVEVEPCARRRP